MTRGGGTVRSGARAAGPLAASAARILDASGDVVGAGFVVGPGQVATCAHVVSAVLGGSPEDPAVPAGRLRVDLPLVVPPHTSDAAVRTWHPIDPATGTGDVAILELAVPPPSPARLPPLHRPDRPWGHRFRVLGFPAGMQDGVWSGGELRDRQGTRWLQLQGQPHSPPIAQGFSGAPVWDEEVGAVVGMTVASDVRPGSTTAYLLPIEDVLGVDPRLLPNPYRGLEPFGEEHADLFYGREDEIDRLEALLGRQPVVAVVGRSGTGKSSLVRAGLLPRLRRRGVHIVDLRPGPADGTAGATLDRIDDVLAGLVAADAGAGPGASGADPADGAEPAAGTDPAATADPEDARPEPGATADPETARAEQGAEPAWTAETAAATVDRQVVLFADQFEELVGLGPAGAGPTPAQDVLRRLVDVARAAPALPDGAPSLQVVLTLRWEAMNELVTGDVVETLDRGTFSLAAMSRDQLRQAVVGPTARAPGLEFDPGLVERILDDAVAEPGQLPLVESLLAQLWQSREGGTLTTPAYERLGGVTGAVARHAEHAVGRLAPVADGAAEVATTATTEPAATAEPTATTTTATTTATAETSTTAETVETTQAAETAEAATTEPAATTTTATTTATAEPAGAATTATSPAAVRRVLTMLARPDDGGGFVRRAVRLGALSPDQQRIVEGLARSRLLVVGQDASGDHTVELAHQALIDHWPRLRGWLDEDRDFLLWEHEVDRQRQVWERAGHDDGALLRGVALVRAREWLARRGDDIPPPGRAFVRASLHREQRESHRRRALLSASAAAVALVLVLGTTLVYQRREARREAAVSASRGLVTLSTDTADSDPVLSMMTALAAYQAEPTPEAERALFAHYVDHGQAETVLSGGGGDIEQADASSDGRVIAARNVEGVVTVWTRTATGEHRRHRVPGEALAMDVAADGRSLALLRPEQVSVYDPESRSDRWEVPTPDQEAVEVRVADDDRHVGVVHLGPEGNRVELWRSVAPGERRPVLVGRVDFPWASLMGFGPERGTLVVAVGGDEVGTERLVLWNAASGAVEEVHDDVTGVGVSDTGLVVACDDGADDTPLPEATPPDAAPAGAPAGDETAIPSPRDETAIPSPGDETTVGEPAGEGPAGEGPAGEGPAGGGPAGEATPAAPDGAEAGTSSGILSVLDPAGRRERTVPLPDDAFCAGGVGVDPEGRTALVGSVAVDLTTGRSFPQPSLATMPLVTQSIVVSRGDRDLIVTAGPSSVVLTEVRREEESLPVSQAVLTPDGRHVVTVTSSGDSIAVRDADLGPEGGTVAHADRPEPRWTSTNDDLAVSADGRLVADRVAPDRVQVRRLPGLGLVSEVTTEPAPDESDEELLPNEDAGSDLGFAHGRLLTESGTRAEWWDPATGESVGDVDLVELGLTDVAGEEGVSFAPLGPERVAVALPRQPVIRILDVGSGRQVDEIRVGAGTVDLVAQEGSPYLLLFRSFGLVELWDVEQGRRVRGPFGGSPNTRGNLTARFLDEPGRFLLTDDGLLRVYQADSLAPERDLQLAEPARAADVHPLAASADGRTLLYADVSSGWMRSLTLEPPVWEEEVCGVLGRREFTDEELATLPEGVASRPLC